MKTIFLVLLVALSAEPAMAQTANQDNRTQIVAQWLMTSNSGGFWTSLWDGNKCINIDQALDNDSGNLYFDDGNDVGAGTCNYLYTTQVSETVAFLIGLEKQGKLPTGLRIGVAKYTKKDHSDWVYIPAYPPGLSKFDIMAP